MAQKDDKARRKAEKLAARERPVPDFDALAEVLTGAARALRTDLSRRLVDAGLYAGQDQILSLLGTQDGLSTGQLAQETGVRPPTMTRSIARLEAQGFVERRGDPADQRLTRVYLTASGRSSLMVVAAARTACGERMLAGLSNKELRQIGRLLAHLERNLDPDGAERTGIQQDSDED